MVDVALHAALAEDPLARDRVHLQITASTIAALRADLVRSARLLDEARAAVEAFRWSGHQPLLLLDLGQHEEAEREMRRVLDLQGSGGLPTDLANILLGLANTQLAAGKIPDGLSALRAHAATALPGDALWELISSEPVKKPRAALGHRAS